MGYENDVDQPVMNLYDDKSMIDNVSLYHKNMFKDIYYYLYSNSNIPRAERLASEFIRILFCKLFDVSEGKQNLNEIIKKPNNEADRLLKDHFEEVKNKYSDIFYDNEHIYIDISSAKYILSKLSNIDFNDPYRDILAESFQAFIAPAVRGEKGQFFTPQSAAMAMIKILDPSPNDSILDPACGSGTFLSLTYSYLNQKNKKISKRESPSSLIFGIDREQDLVKISKTYMALSGYDHTKISCFDSLDESAWTDEWSDLLNIGFDIIMTNPPFGTKIAITN